MPKKRYVVIMWIATSILFILCNEVLDEPDGSVHALVLFFLLIYYIISKATKGEYIPKFDIMAALSFTIISFPLILFVAEKLSKLTGFDGLIYLFYSPMNLMFVAFCVLINVMIFFIKKAKKSNK